MNYATLEEFLQKKKVSIERMKIENPILWQQLEKEFQVLGALNFDHRKKYFINDWRLMFPVEVILPTK